MACSYHAMYPNAGTGHPSCTCGDDDWTPICGRVCACKPAGGFSYAGECTKDAGHVQAGDRKHSTGYCEWDEPSQSETDKDRPTVGRSPVDVELFKRTAPRWNCVDYPDGPHYTPGTDACLWCGKSRELIAKEYSNER